MELVWACGGMVVMDRPIIFSGPMVRALLDGRKTQTRRMLNPQPKQFELKDKTLAPVGLLHVEGECVPRITVGRVLTGQKVRYAVGDRLYVRENFAIVPATAYRCSEGVQFTVNPNDRDNAAIYAAGWDRSIPKWKPCIHMPRWASRLTLIVTDVRVQRLQDISAKDAEAEGVFRHVAVYSLDKVFRDQRGAIAVEYFSSLWNSIHGAEAWEANPWVVAITFTVHKGNIDKVQHGAPHHG